MTKFLFLFGCLGLFWQCKSPETKENSPLLALNGELIYFYQLPKAPLQVFFYFGPECPLSENYTAHANKLVAQYGQDSVRFTVIIPGHFDDSTSVSNFAQRFRLQLPVYRDTSWQLTRSMAASITPEVFVFAGEKQLYHGAIDNWAVSLGTQRRKATEHYLENVLSAYFAGQWPSISHIPAIGCFIEPPKR